MEQTQQRPTEQAGPKIGITLESMRRIEDQVSQWMLLEEHYTQYGLDRRQQLDYAKNFYRSILSEVRQAQKESGLVCDIVSA